MEVTREVINKETYLITDYIYNNDNVGINLASLNTMKTKKKLDVSGIPIDYSPVLLNRIDSAITITSTMNYNPIDEELSVVAEVKYPHVTTIHERKLSDEEFAKDIINTCIVDKKDIKNMKCYKEAFDSIINAVNESAIEEGVLIKTPELYYKCYIYSNTMELLGVANRLLETNNGYILAEYIGKKLNELSDKTIYIDMCINEEITLQLANVKIEDSIDSSLTYSTLNTSNVMVKRLQENYTNINMNIPQGFNLPNHTKFKTMNDYFEELMKLNSPKNIEKFFKDNKVKSNNTIDINKYLIW